MFAGNARSFFFSLSPFFYVMSVNPSPNLINRVMRSTFHGLFLPWLLLIPQSPRLLAFLPSLLSVFALLSHSPTLPLKESIN